MCVAKINVLQLLTLKLFCKLKKKLCVYFISYFNITNGFECIPQTVVF